MKRYTINDYNRTRLNNQPLSASTYRKINEALSLLQEEKDKKGKKEDDEIEEDVLNELFGFGKSPISGIIGFGISSFFNIIGLLISLLTPNCSSIIITYYNNTIK